MSYFEGAIVDTIMVTELSLAVVTVDDVVIRLPLAVVTVDDIVVGLPLVVILHSSVKSASVPGTVQSNFAAFENKLSS